LLRISSLIGCALLRGRRCSDFKLSEIAFVLVYFYHVASIILNTDNSIVWAAVEFRVMDCASLTVVVAGCAARAACAGFGFTRNTAATFDVFYWLQVTSFDVPLLHAAPNGADYIDIFALWIHCHLFVAAFALGWQRNPRSHKHFFRYCSLKSPLCSCVSITLPTSS